MEKQTVEFNKIESCRLDVFLSEVTGFTRSRIANLIKDGLVKVDGKAPKSSKILKCGEIVEYLVPDPKSLEISPVNLPIDIIYQDEDVAVINKSQGVTVHAGTGTGEDTLVNALLYHLDNLSGINGTLRPGIVHRIDKNTSGLLVVAKNDKAHISLASQLSDKSCRRTYFALLEGVLKDDKGVISTFIGRSPKDRKKMAVLPFGRDAVTEYKVIERFALYTLCEFSLKTGRTHQIRVHAKHIGHPIVGDKEYGFKNQKFKLNGQLLHAGELSFIHPTSKKRVTFKAPLPDYFNDVLKKIEKTKV